ncbi:MAG: ammonium transporter [Methanomassiliicoccaceae archaeon]|nr:ammonium transporter [Methanomassiliicoccaceae archaeon]
MKIDLKILCFVILFTVAAALLFFFSGIPGTGGPAAVHDEVWENLKFVKNVMIWFMLMLVAFLMIFVKKYEWGVALAVLLAAAGSFVVYLFIHDVYFKDAWNQDLMLGAVICSITLVIAIGCFLGTVKMWQYLLIGILFAPSYVLIEWFIGNVTLFGAFAQDPGGSILVHMCAAYFGLGVAVALREKRTFKEPMYTTTHSVSFVWLAAMLLWVLWPAFVTALLPMDLVTIGMITCYLAGIGSVISAWIVCYKIQKKVDPLVYTYAMLAGPVAIGAPLLMVGPWAALAVGIVAGIVSALSFIYLQPRLCDWLGARDVMGVHNLHGVAGWVGVAASSLVMLLYGAVNWALANIAVGLIVFVAALSLGIVSGIVLKMTRGCMCDDELFSDDADFIKNEEPMI